SAQTERGGRLERRRPRWTTLTRDIVIFVMVRGDSPLPAGELAVHLGEAGSQETAERSRCADRRARFHAPLPRTQDEAIAVPYGRGQGRREPADLAGETCDPIAQRPPQGAALTSR